MKKEDVEGVIGNDLAINLNLFQKTGILNRKYYYFQMMLISLFLSFIDFFSTIYTEYCNIKQINSGWGVILIFIIYLSVCFLFYPVTYKRIKDIMPEKNITWRTLIFILPIISFYPLFKKGKISEKLHENKLSTEENNIFILDGFIKTKNFILNNIILLCFLGAIISLDVSFWLQPVNLSCFIGVWSMLFAFNIQKYVNFKKTLTKHKKAITHFDLLKSLKENSENEYQDNNNLNIQKNKLKSGIRKGFRRIFIVIIGIICALAVLFWGLMGFSWNSGNDFSDNVFVEYKGQKIKAKSFLEDLNGGFAIISCKPYKGVCEQEAWSSSDFPTKPFPIVLKRDQMQKVAYVSNKAQAGLMLKRYGFVLDKAYTTIEYKVIMPSAFQYFLWQLRDFSYIALGAILLYLLYLGLEFVIIWVIKGFKND